MHQADLSTRPLTRLTVVGSLFFFLFLQKQEAEHASLEAAENGMLTARRQELVGLLSSYDTKFKGKIGRIKQSFSERKEEVRTMLPGACVLVYLRRRACRLACVRK